MNQSKRVRGEGRAWRRAHGGWTIAYYVPSRGEQRESVARALNKPPAAVTEREASQLLTQRLADVGRGEPITAATGRLTVGEVLTGYVDALIERRAKSIAPVRSRVKALTARLGDLRVAALTPALVRRRYTEARASEGVSEGAIHQDLVTLTAALNLARKEGQISDVPYVPKPPAPASRQGFVEPETFAAIHRQLTGAAADALEFAYLTGWRSEEIAGLQWANVFRREGEIRLADTKNGDARVIPLAGRLAALIERCAASRALACPWVFHDAGRPLAGGRLLRALKRAAAAAGVPGLLVHDLRRSAVRNMIRAGVRESVAMAISGHRSRAVFQRYNITSVDDQRRALEAVETYRITKTAR